MPYPPPRTNPRTVYLIAAAAVLVVTLLCLLF